MHSGPISSRFAVMSTNGLAQMRVVFKTCLNYLSSNSKSRETLDFYLPFILPLVVHKRQMTSKHFFRLKMQHELVGLEPRFFDNFASPRVCHMLNLIQC